MNDPISFDSTINWRVKGFPIVLLILLPHPGQEESSSCMLFPQLGHLKSCMDIPPKEQLYIRNQVSDAISKYDSLYHDTYRRGRVFLQNLQILRSFINSCMAERYSGSSSFSSGCLLYIRHLEFSHLTPKSTASLCLKSLDSARPIYPLITVFCIS